jgi:hypothetical protein
MARTRKTWKQAEVDKTASPPPQIPAVDRTEGPDHPAYYEDPDKDKYKSGDTSSWAEDPHKPMSPESPPPAMPGNFTTEKPEHPGISEFSEKPQSPEAAAAEGGGGGKSASEQPSLKQMAEQRANLCVRIASAMMKDADAGAVENKALELMDLDDAQLQATAKTLKVLAGEEEEEVEEEELEIEGGKKANVELTARLDKIENSMTKMVKAMTHFFGMEGEEDGMSDRELMAYLMAEDADGDGVDQNAPDYAYSDKSSGEEESEFDRGEESEGTELSDEAEGDKMAMEEESMLRAMLEEMDGEMSMSASKKAEEEEEEEEIEVEGGKKASEAEETTTPLAKGSTIQSGEGGNVNPDEYAPTPVVAQSDGSEKVGDPTPHGKSAGDGVAENDIEITAGVDPMGLMDESQKEASADDELMQLYADLDLPKSAGEDEMSNADDDIGGGDTLKDMEEVEEKAKEEGEEESPKASKKADEDVKLKPQQKAASTGAQKLGNVAGQAKVAATEISELQKLWESAPDVSEVFGVPGAS